jgi:hypothetical protein
MDSAEDNQRDYKEEEFDESEHEESSSEDYNRIRESLKSNP